jgi:DNA polymerase-3 subunit delta'
MFDDFDIDDDGGGAGDDSQPLASTLTLSPPASSCEYWGDETLEQHLLVLFNAGRLPHGMIFSGIKGVGKATFAYRFTRFLMKESEKSDSSMGGGLFGGEEEALAPTSMNISAEDPIFAQIESAAHLDFNIVEPALKTNSTQKRDVIEVAQIRKASDFFKLKSSRDGGWRVALIDDADLMNRSAQNALLKLLEEPPKNALIILVCHRLGSMLPTIRSRCQTFNFAPMGDNKVSDIIQGLKPDVTPEELDLMLSLSAGSVGRAVRFTNEAAFDVLTDLQAALSQWPNLNWPELHMLAERLSYAKDDVTRSTFKEYMLWLFSECIKTKVNRSFINEDWLKAMTASYDLKQLITLQDDLKKHFSDVEIGNLDNMHYYLGAFFLLPTAK